MLLSSSRWGVRWRVGKVAVLAYFLLLWLPLHNPARRPYPHNLCSPVVHQPQSVVSARGSSACDECTCTRVRRPLPSSLFLSLLSLQRQKHAHHLFSLYDQYKRGSLENNSPMPLLRYQLQKPFRPCCYGAKDKKKCAMVDSRLQLWQYRPWYLLLGKGDRLLLAGSIYQANKLAWSSGFDVGQLFISITAGNNNLRVNYSSSPCHNAAGLQAWNVPYRES